MRPASELISRGTIAGVIAATTMAAWFLVIDTLAGRPFYTPAFIASLLSGLGTVEASVRLIAAYTVVHYVAFLAIGIGVVWSLRKLHTAPGLLLGMVLGFLLFNLVFYGSVLVTGRQVVQELGWPPVLAGNVLAGLALMTYLHAVGFIQPVSWLEILQRHPIVKEGLTAGLLGASTLAVWFLVLDTITGRVLFTPAALGSAVFQGARSMAEVEVSLATVGGYTLLHLTGFLIVGFVAAAAVTETEHTPPLLLASVLLFVTFGALFSGLLAVIAEWILEALVWWSVLIGNLLAAAAISGYLWRQHPVLRRQLQYAREHPSELEEPA